MKKSTKRFLFWTGALIWVAVFGIIISFLLSSSASGFEGEEGVDVGVMETKLTADGEICFVVERLQRTGIFVSAEARQYPNEWREVFEDVGKVEPVLSGESDLQWGGWFYFINAQGYERVLLYDNATNIIVVKKEKGEIRGEKKSIPYPLIVVSVVVFLMIFCLFLPRREASEGQDFVGSF